MVSLPNDEATEEESKALFRAAIDKLCSSENQRVQEMLAFFKASNRYKDCTEEQLGGAALAAITMHTIGVLGSMVQSNRHVFDNAIGMAMCLNKDMVFEVNNALSVACIGAIVQMEQLAKDEGTDDEG